MKVLESIHKTWKPVVSMLYRDPLKKLNEEILPNISFQPKREHIFRVFEKSISNIKIVILGQDPYPRPGDAIGFAFAINPGSKKPPSLRNIQKEIENCDSYNLNGSGEIDLLSWVDQDVLLLNTALTVETGQTGSHLRYWEDFTKKVVNYISSAQPTIWLLWGRKAQSFIPYISNPIINVKGYSRKTIKNIPSSRANNYIISSPHPAAEAYTGGNAGFFGSNCFYFANTILDNNHLNKIIW